MDDNHSPAAEEKEDQKKDFGGEINIDISMKSVGKWLPLVAIILIIILSMYIRLFGFYDAGYPYLRNIDSFFFMHEMNDIVNNGGILPSVDELRFAPNGFERGGPQFYSYLGAYSYMFFRIFLPDMQLWEFLIWFPALLASLIAIPAYYIGRYLFDKKAGVFSALFMVFAIPFVTRSLGGDPDSDAIVMLLLMSSIASFIITYKNLDKVNIFSKKNIIYSAITGIFIGLFALTWVGYWFSLVIIVGFIVGKIILDFAITRKHDFEHFKRAIGHAKPLIFSLIVIMIFFYILTVPVFGPSYFVDPLTRVVGSVGEADAIKSESESFPNVFVSVAELQPGGDIRNVAVRAGSVDIASQISGLPTGLLILISPFLLSIVAFIYLGYSYYKRREHLDTLLFMLIWFVGFLVATVVAIRFSIFLAPVYSILSAIILSKFWSVAAKHESIEK